MRTMLVVLPLAGPGLHPEALVARSRTRPSGTRKELQASDQDVLDAPRIDA